MVCGDGDVVEYLDEGMLSCLDNNDKDDFDVYFLHAHPLEYLLEETLGGKCLVHHGYMQKLAGVIPMSTSVITITTKNR